MKILKKKQSRQINNFIVFILNSMDDCHSLKQLQLKTNLFNYF